MGALVLGLYTEGDTDKRFLQPVIRRAVTKILVEHRRNDRWDDLLMEKLALLSAYRQFISDLMSTLTEPGIIPPIS